MFPYGLLPFYGPLFFWRLFKCLTGKVAVYLAVPMFLLYEILYLLTDDLLIIKVDIHTLKETFSIYGAMNELETQLSKSFYRCHKM